MTLKEHAETNKIQWKRIERHLTEILASYGEPPLYANRLNRLRRGSRPTSAEVRALLEYSRNEIESYKD